MSKKLGEIDGNSSAEFINDSLLDFYNESPVDTLDDFDESEEDDSIYENTVQPTVETNTVVQEDDEDDDLEEDEEISPTEPVVESDVDSLDDYNNLALIALSLKQEDPELLDFDIDKDLNAEKFVTSLKSRIDKVKSDAVASVEEQYGEAARYLNMILEGAPDSVVQTGLNYNSIGNIELTGDESEEDLEGIVKQWLFKKGTPDIDDLVDVYKDKGVLREKAIESIEFHKQQEELYYQQWVQNRDTERATALKQQQVYQNSVKAQIAKGVVKGLKIKDKKKLEDAIFKPTEIVEYIDNSGKKVLQKVPLLNLKMEALYKDVEQQLALQLLLLDDFDFSSLVDTAKRKVNNNLINIINDRTSKDKPTKTSSSTYFED